MSVRQGGKTIAGSVGQYPLNEKNITNCITNIPQDIKLELNNGTLTLKAGSKVYVPNGSGVFDEVPITADKTNSFSWMASGIKYLLTYKTDDNIVDAGALIYCSSGTSFPAGAEHGWICYRTDENKIYRHNGSNWENTLGLPLGIVTGSGSGVASIDQVFNGFGYIGSTVFALPGLKGLIPDGRNADGTLKNIEVTVNNVLTHTGSYNNHPQWVIIYSDSISAWDSVDWMGYNSQENILFNKEGSSSATSGSKIVACVGAFLSADGNQKITAFTPKTAFHAVDYSEADFVVAFQRPTAQNNYTWYRKYKSGWVEQGGIGVAGSGITYVTLPVQMANAAYTATGAILYSGTSEGTIGFQFIKHTFELGIGARWNGLFNNGLAVDWQVSGMAAN